MIKYYTYESLKEHYTFLPEDINYLSSYSIMILEKYLKDGIWNLDINFNINCKDCENCADCQDCENCKNCYHCKNCKDCVGCLRCQDCKNCKDGFHFSNIKNYVK